MKSLRKQNEIMLERKKTGIISNFVYNVIYQVVRMILPLITIPYVSRVLGAENLGIFNYTNSVALYFAMAAYLGFENYGNRLIAQNKHNQKELNRSFSGAYSFQIISSIIAIISYSVYILFFCKENQSVAWAQMIYVSSELININWLYFGLEKFRKTTLINIIVRVISFVAIVLFVNSKDDLIVYTIICSLTIFVSTILLWPGTFKYVHFTRVSLEKIWYYGKGSLVLFFPVLVVSIYRTMDKIMLGNIANMTEVALYANADKIVEVPYGVITALGVVMIPRMSSMVATGQTEKSHKYIEISMRFMLFLACGMCFGMMGIGKVFAPVFFGVEFTACGILIMVIAPMVIVRACANVVRTQYLLPNNRDKDYIISIVGGVIVNLVLNSLMIPIWKSTGAAIATLCAESFVALYQIVVSRKDIPVARYTFRNWFFLLAGLIMFVPVYIIGENHPYMISTLVIQILAGVIIYMITGGLYLYMAERRLILSIIKRKHLEDQ